jgi:hypothetical protein
VSLAWCNPVEHARVMVDVCGLDKARELAMCNLEFAGTTSDVRYWFQVTAALFPEADA